MDVLSSTSQPLLWSWRFLELVQDLAVIAVAGEQIMRAPWIWDRDETVDTIGAWRAPLLPSLPRLEDTKCRLCLFSEARRAMGWKL